ncbi:MULTISPECIES: glycosylhydrolase-like jelly roll fold domain-containing protein [Lachnospiraceae]|jgi:hypothetical protein|uniref:Glycoside hydrolase family 2 n=1 Tax=Faecalicatena acetigenes TaxID=2981790 RepID=A0ABT2TB82_9FIRM|nr:MULTISPECIES: glycosylhydrolase-like jelly roll fold domain-containing protein [Lachnospiraceae]MCU6747132.1 hypothetical protein [Faecalicatena acetigenes]RGT74154.1 glycosyl transferase family 2 [Ruminococcus sp. AF18-22]SCH67287.1 Glycosyl hydrolases family 2%2C sugar binding domain [uncultured Clostridium sp.]
MKNGMEEVLKGKGENYILPFLWLRGENRERLGLEMKRIHDSGIGAVCIESRPHPDFLGEQWWEDTGYVMKLAKEYGMKVWFLDDSHYPTGYCAGKLTEDSPYVKQYISHYMVDVVGPAKELSFMVKLEKGERFLGALLLERDKEAQFSFSNIKDISDKIQGDFICTEIPEGFYAVMIIKVTKKSTGREKYLNVIDKEAVRFFIDTVYEAHYAHYKKEFGNTFAGFFSDEPGFGNIGWEHEHAIYLGRYDMDLPWCEELEIKLKERWGDTYRVSLASLWGETPEAPRLRYDFMDLATQLYADNFCGQIGTWCREKGVEYMGHIIEDGGMHARLGGGAGHYFRALWGQDYAGIDVVLQQIRPQLDDTAFYRVGGKQFYYGEFYHYGLAKLALSLAFLDPKKEGRAMSEIFGAYGWAEGLKMMTWLANHMMVRGINVFVPHAFSMKPCPDPDSPPHFSADGKNPQFPYFKNLMTYMNRVCHLIQNGRRNVSIGVLYTAEAEWMGDKQPFERAGKWLTRNQIDYDVLPMDLLTRAEVENGSIRINQEVLRLLVVPSSEHLPAHFLSWMKQAQEKGLKIVRTADKWNTEGLDEKNLLHLIRQEKLDEVDVKAENYAPYLRSYRYFREEGEILLLFNENTIETLDVSLQIPKSREKYIVEYDAWKNTLLQTDNKNEKLRLQFAPGEMRIFFLVDVDRKKCTLEEMPEIKQNRELLRVKKEETISLADFQLYLEEEGTKKPIAYDMKQKTGNVTSAGEKPDFCGKMIYRTSFSCKKTEEKCELDLGEVYETAEVLVNGKSAGVRLTAPYCFDLTDIVREGENHLEIRVVNTLVHRIKDWQSMSMPVEPSGLLGPVKLRQII